jgi:hypothetical protein
MQKNGLQAIILSQRYLFNVFILVISHSQYFPILCIIVTSFCNSLQDSMV